VAFFARETGLNRNVDGTDQFRSTNHQWGLRADAIHVRGSHRLGAGLLVRELSEDAVARDFDGRTMEYSVTEDYDATSAQPGAYLQDTWTGVGGRLNLTAGVRFDHFVRTGETSVLPRGAAAWSLSKSTRVLAAFGAYAQFPGFEELLGRHANPELEAERATHYSLAVEQGLFANVRVRVEAYHEGLRGVFFSPGSEWHREGAQVVPPMVPAPVRNALDGQSQGVEVLVQRRSANGLTGWIAYSLGRARRHEEGGPLFDADFDQRHTLTVFASYRVGPTVNLSTKYRYGSGFPVAGFYEERPEGVFLAEARNTYRPEAYSRWDLRANKAFLFRGWKLTVFAEVINVLDRTHTRYTDLNAVNPRTGRVFIDTDTLFPLLPSLGVTVEF
jgi:outer membrane cobalamin receptor